jgi:hypothetical protein
MAKLKNVFSWSFSAASDFEDCRRKRYWNKYGKWGGWDKNADPVQKKAYQLDKMDNLYSILGQAVELSIMHVLRQHQSGKSCDINTAYDQVAKPFMNRAWKDSKGELWKQNPKEYKCLREHYYKTLSPEQEKELTVNIIKRTKTCIGNFIRKTLPRIMDITPNLELPVQTPEMRGDTEHFVYEGVKIYAIPDYTYRKDGIIHIHDWKAGKQKNAHKDQLAVYGLWADIKHRKDKEEICAYVEYLKDGKVLTSVMNDNDLLQIKNRIESSVADMTEFLIDANRERNEPLPKDEWEITTDGKICEYCNFYELCESELHTEGIV